jgi:antirestriction protein ArdC
MDEHDLIHSPLQQIYRDKDRWVEICIYRMPNTGWTLEVVDDKRNSTVWDGEFQSDQEALEFALSEINAMGIVDFIDSPPTSSLH